MNEEYQEKYGEIEEPQEPIDLPQEKNPHKRKPAWVQEAIQGAERYGAPEENHREIKRTRFCSGYVALLCDFIDKKPSKHEEVTERKKIEDTPNGFQECFLEWCSGRGSVCGATTQF